MVGDGINGKADSFIKQAQTSTGLSFKREEDVSRILELIFKHDKEVLLENLTFNSKYVSGLLNIIRRKDANVDGDYLLKVTKEYSEYLEKIKIDLTEIISFASSFYKNVFEEKYFSQTMESLEELNMLCGDFGIVKNYLNEKKRTSC